MAADPGMENGTCSDDPWKFWGANPIEQMAAQLPPESQAFLKGLIYDWNVVFVPSGNQVRGGTFHASIALRDRGLLTDGFRVLIQVQDKNGNYNAVEKEGTLEKNLAQKAGEWVADAVNAVVRGFIAWLVETIGTIAGIIIGILAGIIKSIIDMIVGLVDMIIHLPEMLGMIGQIGSIFGNLGQVFLAMVDGWTNEAEWVMPASWAGQCAKPAAAQVLDLVMGKFQDTQSANGTCARTEYIKNYVIGAIAGFIIGMLIGGGISGALKSLKTINGFKQVANKVEKAMDAGKDAAKAASGGVKTAAKSSNKAIRTATQSISRAVGEVSDSTAAAIRKASRGMNRAELDRAATSHFVPMGARYLDYFDGKVVGFNKRFEELIKKAGKGDVKGQDDILFEARVIKRELDSPDNVGKNLKFYSDQGKSIKTDYLSVFDTPDADGFFHAFKAKSAKNTRLSQLQEEYRTFVRDMKQHIDDLKTKRDIILDPDDYQLVINMPETVPDGLKLEIETLCAQEGLAAPFFEVGAVPGA